MFIATIISKQLPLAKVRLLGNSLHLSNQAIMAKVVETWQGSSKISKLFRMRVAVASTHATTSNDRV